MSRVIFSEEESPLKTVPTGKGSLQVRATDKHLIFKDDNQDEFDITAAITPPTFGENRQFARLPGSFSTTSTTLQTVLDFTTPSLPSGEYLVSVQYIWAYDSSTSDFVAELQQNNSTLKRHQQEPKDTGGGGPGGTNQRHAGFMEDIINIAGVQSFQFKIAASAAGIEAYVERVLLKFHRWV